MARIMLKKDISLLSKSNITKEYPILLNFMKETPKLKKSKMNTLAEQERQFFRNIYPSINNEATKEWTVDKSSVRYAYGENMRCELCGQPIINVCVIENKLNKNRLQIGSECVKYYEINSDFNIDALLEESKRIKKLEHIDSIFPGIERIIMHWDSFIEEQEILIKKDVKGRYQKTGEDAKRIFEEYLDKRATITRSNEIIEEMKNILERKDKEIKEIQNYVDENRSNWLIPSRSLINRIKYGQTPKKWELLEMLENDGIIKHRTMFRIRDEGFSKSLIQPYNQELERFGCAIDKVDVYNGSLGYQITYKKKPRIKLFCSHNDLCINYYKFITGDEGDDISFEGLITISKIHGNSSVENAIYDLFDQIKNKEFVIEENGRDIYHEFNDMYIYSRKESSYYKLAIDELIDKFTSDIFLNIKSVKDRFYDYISRSSKIAISQEDMEYIRDERDGFGKRRSLGM